MGVTISSGRNRHMATVRSHNKGRNRPHVGPKRALTKQQRAMGANAIHNRGIVGE